VFGGGRLKLLSSVRASRPALWPNLLCCRPARIRCENYGKIILKRSVHRFNYETFQTLADVGRAHSSNIIVMICHDRLNCSDFLLGSHVGTFNLLFSVGNHEWNEISDP
jgi:hypothetical protein